MGSKRNVACEAARGDIVVHWDDDDWMAEWRLSYQVKELLEARADACGLDRLMFYEPASGRSWQYDYPKKKTPLLAGGSLCYFKRLWEDNPFSATNIGEDTRFIWSKKPKKLLSLDDNTFYIALIHPGNTNPRNTGRKRWRPIGMDRIHKLLAKDWTFYNSLCATEKKEKKKQAHSSAVRIEVSGGEPLVSCIMPTANRRLFLAQAVTYFLRQKYPNKELVIVDDGTVDVADLILQDNRIRYIRLDRKATVGHKRNIAVQHSKGEIIAHWDDDDWYAKDRLRYQVQAMLAAEAKVCGLDTGFFYSVLKNTFWSCSPVLHAKLFFADVNGRSIMYRKELWKRDSQYPEIPLGEDAAFLKNVLKRKVKIVKLDNDNKMIYIRHRTNAWRFECGKFVDPNAWQSIHVPGFLPAQDLQFYQNIHRDHCLAGSVGSHSFITFPKTNLREPS